MIYLYMNVFTIIALTSQYGFATGLTLANVRLPWWYSVFLGVSVPCWVYALIRIVVALGDLSWN